MNCLCADPTTEKELPLIDLAAKVGAEYYVMDAGWYADGTWWETVGEWLPCDWRFPNGIKEVFDYIREKGMIPGLWVEIESMGINCPILDQFDDDCFFMRHGKRVIDHGRYQLDFRNEKVRKFATGIIDRIYNEYGVRYIKNDYNIEAGQGTECYSDSYGDGLLGHGRAYLAWIEEMLDKYPDLIIEGCASGAMRADYATLSKYSIYSVTDCTDYKKMSRIARACATGFLPEQAAIWTYPKACDDDTATAFNMVNAMLTRIHLSGEIANISNSQFELIKEGVACYKEIRKNIKDFVAFYPEGVGSYDKDWLCVGYSGNGNTYLGVWRLEPKEDEHFFPFKTDKKSASVIYPSKNDVACELFENGIKVKLPKQNSAVIIKLN
jgi:alpha-galactosidase